MEIVILIDPCSVGISSLPLRHPESPIPVSLYKLCPLRESPKKGKHQKAQLASLGLKHLVINDQGNIRRQKAGKDSHYQTLILARGIIYILLLRKTWSFGKWTWPLHDCDSCYLALVSLQSYLPTSGHLPFLSCSLPVKSSSPLEPEVPSLFYSPQVKPKTGGQW